MHCKHFNNWLAPLKNVWKLWLENFYRTTPLNQICPLYRALLFPFKYQFKKQRLVHSTDMNFEALRIFTTNHWRILPVSLPDICSVASGIEVAKLFFRSLSFFCWQEGGTTCTMHFAGLGSFNPPSLPPSHRFLGKKENFLVKKYIKCCTWTIKWYFC